MNRKKGFYWVKSHNQQMIAKWDRNWYLPGIEKTFDDQDFETIDKNILKE